MPGFRLRRGSFGAVLLLAVGLSPAAASTPPNLLLVTFDTTRADHIGCYGAAGAITPNIDRLAQRGVRFARAFSPAPLTLPAHAALLTGRLPREINVRDNALFHLDPAEETLAERLHATGYSTGALVAAAVLDRATGIDQGFDFFDDQVRVGPKSWFAWQERAASQVIDALLPRLDRLKPPFFLWVHFYDPHIPYVPPDRFRKMLPDRLYDGEIAFADEQFGRLLNELQRRGWGTNLVVALAGDHGESLGEHGEAAHGVFVYEATQRIPLILAGPGIPAGKVIDRPVALIDLAPTLLELLGQSGFSRATGRSVAGSWNAATQPATADPPIELESHYPRLAFGWAPLRGLIHWPYKFIFGVGPELYDLARDPQEKQNLAAQLPEKARDYQRELAQRLGTEWDRPPAAGEEAELDLERIERLRSLGYASAPSAATAYSTIDPRTAIVWNQELDRARQLTKTGRPVEALKLLEPLVAKNAENFEATLSLISARQAASQFDKAVAQARAAVGRWPKHHLTHFHLAQALIAVGGAPGAARSEAEREYRAAVALNPHFAEGIQALALLLLETKREPEARTLLADAEQRGVVDPDLLLLRGTLDAAAGRLEDADRAFARAVALDPGSARALEGRGKLAFSRGDAATAAHFYQQALDRSPNAALARTLGAIYLHRLKDPQKARAVFLRALELEPNGPDAPEVRALIAELSR